MQSVQSFHTQSFTNSVVLGLLLKPLFCNVVITNWLEKSATHYWFLRKRLGNLLVFILNSMEGNKYQCPTVEVLELYSEGVLCDSNEIVYENDGIW